MRGTERDGKADAGIKEHIVVGKIASVALEDVGGDVGLVEEFLGRAEFVVVGARGPYRELGDFGLRVRASGEVLSSRFSMAGVPKARS